MRLLEAIHQIRVAWATNGRQPEHGDPEFWAKVHDARRAIEEADRLKSPEPQLTGVKFIMIKERFGEGRYVSRVVVRWSNETIGEALAWYTGSVVIHGHELVGLTVDELERLLGDRLLGVR